MKFVSKSLERIAAITTTNDIASDIKFKRKREKLMAPLRWGIASAGRISFDFANALSTLPEVDHKIVAVGARNLTSARDFAKKFDIPKYYEGYDKLVKDENIDVIYIGSIVATHFEIGMLALEAGKHVLCEKPLSINEKQSRKLFETARAKGLFFAEAIWSRYFESYKYIRQRVDNGDLGEIKEIELEFGFPLADTERLFLKNGGGSTLDLGIYTIQLSLWVYRTEPTKVTAFGKLNDDGLDMEFTGEYKFPNGGISHDNLTITKSDSGEKKSSVEKIRNNISDHHQSPSLQPIFIVQNYFNHPARKFSTKATNTDALIREGKSQQTSREPSSHSKMGNSDVGSCCAKYILCIFNFIFFILGSLVLGLGLWLLFDKNSLLSLMKSVNSEHIERFTEPKLIDQTVYLLITIGVLMFVLGFLGYCGAMRESQCLLSLYGVFLIILLVLEIVVFVFAIAYQDVARDETESFLRSTIKEYKSSGKEEDAVSLMWNQLMAQFQCCGVNSYSDFETSSFWVNNKGSRTIPEACCQLSDKTLIKPLDLNCPYSPSDINSYYMRGCQPALVEFFRNNSNTIIGVMSGVILIQLFAAFLAFCIS
ncbi:hypothetical protein PVAND_009035 [Polypedilum vanderplanki]|uniref:Trans-1,2-dihydrobenzene-1,2-diol dehydrogenase n=1 Tax=Polypedilum vanderplanki TaxID=319348 RepID=A0A9J6CCV8_POLVA|nr:hypothetical protein PVAND_009035 [Polypedilum vanderplanki]